MSDLPSPPNRDIVAQVATILSNAAAPWALVSLVVILIFLTGCAVDPERVDRLKSDVRTLCADPVTSVGRSICDRYTVEPVSPDPAPE